VPEQMNSVHGRAFLASNDKACLARTVSHLGHDFLKLDILVCTWLVW